MSTRLDAGTVVRSDLFSIDPQFIIAEDETNGRGKPHTQEDIDEKVQSILKYDQLQPALGRRVQGNKVQLVFGFCRLAAIRKINDEKLSDKPYKLLVRVLDMDDKEAFVRNLAENMHRSSLTPFDHARNQRKLREDFGWTDAEIAEFYEHSRSYVTLLKKSHQVVSEVKEKVEQGEMTFSDAMPLADLPEAEQKEVVRESTNGDGVVDTKEVRKKIREKKQEKGKGSALTLSEVRKFFERLKEENDVGSMHALADTVLRMMGGTIKEETAEKKLWELIKE